MPKAIATARVAAVLFAFVAIALSAQTNSTGQVVITVVDQSGLPIPTARIGIVQLPAAIPRPLNPSDSGWFIYALHASESMSTEANASGEANLSLARGTYAVSITAPGFTRLMERIDLQHDANPPLRVTLATSSVRVDRMSCCTQPNIPLEHTDLDTLLPLESLKTIPLNTHRQR